LSEAPGAGLILPVAVWDELYRQRQELLVHRRLGKMLREIESMGYYIVPDITDEAVKDYLAH